VQQTKTDSLNDAFEAILKSIAGRAQDGDVNGIWPAQDIAELASIGATRWAIDAPYGDDVNALELHDRYKRIASASLATALVLSQRDAAVGFIEASDNQALRENLLSQLARNERWTTIGISHLTTSTQSGELIAEVQDDGSLQLNGTIPWATGASHADFVVAASRTSDGRQILFALPTDAPGVIVEAPLRLATLSAAHTSSILCKDVRIGADRVLRAPTSSALAGRKRGLPVGQAFAALGLSTAAIRLIEALDHESARQTADALVKQLEELDHSVRRTNENPDTHDLQSGPLVRSACNSLAMRSTHAAVTLYKGTGLRRDHPAQRLAREALFLLVWSSPSSVVDRNLELMSDRA